MPAEVMFPGILTQSSWLLPGFELFKNLKLMISLRSLAICYASIQQFLSWCLFDLCHVIWITLWIWICCVYWTGPAFLTLHLDYIFTLFYTIFNKNFLHIASHSVSESHFDTSTLRKPKYISPNWCRNVLIYLLYNLSHAIFLQRS